MDIAVKWNSQALRGDWVISRGGFLLDAGLHTAVLVSLFTNRRAPPDWTPPAGSPVTRGGYFGDTYSTRPLGSWLWLLYRSSVGDALVVQNKARDYCLSALQWLIDRGIAASIDIETGWIAPGVLGIDGTITKPTGLTVPFSYAWLWQGA
jgi:phage gp46-like protein